jgi:hypothetical protein
MEILIGWFVFSIAVGILASIRGRHGFGWFLLAIFISPLLAGIFCLASKNLSDIDPEKPTPETHVKCPDCREFVLKDARKCKHCGTALIPQ